MEKKASFFDTRAEAWEETFYPPPVRERLEDLIREFGVRPGERLLDVGTGPGVLLPYLYERVGPAGQVCAFDLSMQMLYQAYRKPRTVHGMVFQGDVHHIPFTKGAFDRVICFAAFPHFDDPAQAVGEMSRVLKPGGGLIIAHLMSRRELAEHHKTHETVARDLLPPDPEMTVLFTESDLAPPEIVDMPGRYLARAVKNR